MSLIFALNTVIYKRQISLTCVYYLKSRNLRLRQFSKSVIKSSLKIYFENILVHRSQYNFFYFYFFLVYLTPIS